MRYLIILLIPVLLFAQTVHAQKGTVSLSTQFPGAGDTVTLFYQPDVAQLNRVADHVLVNFRGDNGYDIYKNIPLTANGKMWQAQVVIPLKSLIFFVSMHGSRVIIPDRPKFTSLIYRDRLPAEGAYILLANTSLPDAVYPSNLINGHSRIDLFKKEYELYPHSKKHMPADLWPITDKDTADKKIAEFKLSHVEKVVMLARALLKSQNKLTEANAIDAPIKQKFPRGLLINDELKQRFYKETDPEQKKALLDTFLRTFPETTAKEKAEMQKAVKMLFAKGDHVEQMRLLGGDKYLPQNLNNLAESNSWDDPNLKEAEKLSALSIRLITERIRDPKLKRQKNENLELYYYFKETYANILKKQGRINETLKYLNMIYRYNQSKVISFNHRYINTLLRAGRNDAALTVAEQCLKTGACYPDVLDSLRSTYIKRRGITAWNNRDVAAMADRAKRYQDAADHRLSLYNWKKEMARQILNERAPLFVLKDLNGKTVSLKNLKDKTVLISFGAMWCDQCLFNMRDMAKIAEQYRSDKNVVFLYIDTWESQPYDVSKLKKFVTDNAYNLTVLTDGSIKDGTLSNTVDVYKADALPAWFVVDKAGRIRFRTIGYDPNFVYQIEAAIELVKDHKAL